MKEDLMSVADRLKELGIQLPTVPAPVAAYVPAVRVGNLVFTSGQLPVVEGKLKYAGVVGRDLTLEQGHDAARICCLNALAAVQSVAGDLDAVVQVVKLTGWVASADDFTDQPKVMNGASELVCEIFGAAGRHARAAVAANTLPLGAAVEVEMTVQLRG
jgi:enamine deaminase RidA (YjgF/YER057c/UK114 family)